MTPQTKVIGGSFSFFLCGGGASLCLSLDSVWDLLEEGITGCVRREDRWVCWAHLGAVELTTETVR